LEEGLLRHDGLQEGERKEYPVWKEERGGVLYREIEKQKIENAGTGESCPWPERPAPGGRG